MRQLIKNAQITELYRRKYLKRGIWRHYALIKANDKWIWANDYINKHWYFEKGKKYNFLTKAILEGKDKGKNFLYDYCLAESPRELKRQFRRQWIKPNKDYERLKKQEAKTFI
jgi:hypothetical protein